MGFSRQEYWSGVPLQLESSPQLLQLEKADEQQRGPGTAINK